VTLQVGPVHAHRQVTTEAQRVQVSFPKISATVNATTVREWLSMTTVDGLAQDGNEGHETSAWRMP